MFLVTPEEDKHEDFLIVNYSVIVTVNYSIIVSCSAHFPHGDRNSGSMTDSVMTRRVMTRRDCTINSRSKKYFSYPIIP